jgi:hypothetical protein
MPLSTSSSEPPFIHRDIPDLPWRGIVLAVAVVVVVAATAWELHCRAAGYAPGLDDTTDLWVEARRTVQPDSTVIIGASRGLFDLDLDVLEKGLGKRPVQLSLVGSCLYPVLRQLADDPTFHGTVLCDVVPGLAVVPPMAPPYHNSEKAVHRLATQTWSQWAGHLLSIPLERTFACLQQEDLTLAALLHEMPIPDRPRAQVPPRLPPYFYTIDRDRRSRMTPNVLTDATLRERIAHGWPPLFTPPPKPSWIPAEPFAAFIGKLFNDRFVDIAKAVADLRSRGGKVVFLRLPSSGALRDLEDRLTPRPAVWDRILADSSSPGICYEDHPELAGFICPELSHLSADDSVEFTKRLVPFLVEALGTAKGK